MLSKLLIGKEKAWASSLVMFLSTLIVQLLGGDGPTADQLAEFQGLSGELVVSLVSAGVGYLATYITANSPTKETPKALTELETIGYEDPARFPEVKID